MSVDWKCACRKPQSHKAHVTRITTLHPIVHRGRPSYRRAGMRLLVPEQQERRKLPEGGLRAAPGMTGTLVIVVHHGGPDEGLDSCCPSRTDAPLPTRQRLALILARA